MANKTINYNLTKPLESEFYDVGVQNENMDKIDSQMKANADIIKALQDSQSGKADLVDGRVPADQLPEMNYDTEGTAENKVKIHNEDEAAHPPIQLDIESIELRLKLLELKLNTTVTDNTFSVTFASLEGLEVTGVWNEALARIEF